MGAAAFGLDAHVEVATLEIPVELGPNRFDVGVVASSFLHAGGLLMDQPGPGRLAHHKTAFTGEGVAANQFLQQGLALSHRHHRALGQAAAQLFVENAYGPTPENGRGLGAKLLGPFEAAAHQAQVAPKLSVERCHQLQAAQGTSQPLEGIAGIEHLEGVLERIASPSIDGGIDLDIAPRKHQQAGLESAHRCVEHPLDIQNWHCGQVQDLLAHLGKLLMQMVGQIDRAHRKNRIAGQAHQQNPVIARLDRGVHGTGLPGLIGL